MKILTRLSSSLVAAGGGRCRDGLWWRYESGDGIPYPIAKNIELTELLKHRPDPFYPLPAWNQEIEPPRIMEESLMDPLFFRFKLAKPELLQL